MSEQNKMQEPEQKAKRRITVEDIDAAMRDAYPQIRSQLASHWRHMGLYWLVVFMLLVFIPITVSTFAESLAGPGASFEKALQGTGAILVLPGMALLLGWGIATIEKQSALLHVPARLLIKPSVGSAVSAVWYWLTMIALAVAVVAAAASPFLGKTGEDWIALAVVPGEAAAVLTLVYMVKAHAFMRKEAPRPAELDAYARRAERILLMRTNGIEVNRKGAPKNQDFVRHDWGHSGAFYLLLGIVIWCIGTLVGCVYLVVLLPLLFSRKRADKEACLKTVPLRVWIRPTAAKRISLLLYMALALLMLGSWSLLALLWVAGMKAFFANMVLSAVTGVVGVCYVRRAHDHMNRGHSLPELSAEGEGVLL